ncbi:MAG: hypothetical protein DRH76_01675 [Deltaproteobacteria bacterium]|nr:MAG: hypothetical protein DRH76_01675 [Deltaproteobacteria bacterium]
MKRLSRGLPDFEGKPETGAPSSRAPAGSPAPPPIPRERPGPRLARRSDVERYFLELYRAQLGAAPGAEAELAVVAGDERQQQYRLRLFHQGQWRERRMTIGALGAAGGSKSQCFHVIFDTHLVVKIPPRPIADLPDYLHRLEKEARIAGRLAGRPCVIPNLAAILGRVKRFADAPEDDAARIEALYRQWLAADPSRQRHLKIGGAFAFFMDLSRDRFLGQVLRESIRGAGRLAAVVDEDGALMDDCAAFEQKYGAEAGSICFELHDLYGAFDDRARRALAEAAPDEVVTESEKKDWLLKQAAGLSAGTASRVRPSVGKIFAPLAAELLARRPQTVAAYRRLVRAEAQRRTLRQAKGRMAALAADLLELLAWLGRQGVAMRDLKPDNLLVAGDPARYPHFLSEPGRFAIGLIDLETAVILPADADAGCPQPQLGGTPAYGTPSHFVANAVLGECYHDVGRILHLQDWYATVGILFEIVAGKRLFDRSGRLLAQWLGQIRSRGARPAVGRTDYGNFNSRFWSVAQTEFKARTAAADPWLRAVAVAVPGPLRGPLGGHLQRRGELLRRRIEALVAAGDFSGDFRRRRVLARGTVASLERLTARCQEAPTPANRRLAALLQKLLPLKRAQAQRAAAERALADAGARIPLKALLTMMFEVVAEAMQTASPAAEAPLPLAPGHPPRGTEAALVQCSHSLS